MKAKILIRQYTNDSVKSEKNEITRLNERRELLQYSIEEQENKLISSIQMISFLKEDLKIYKTN